MTRHLDRGPPSRPKQSDAGERAAIWIGLARIRRRLFRVVERWLKRAGLPPLPWHDVLQLLIMQPSGELSAPDLEQKLALRQYQVSRLIQRLAEGGLVRRRRQSVIGRPMLVQITARGRDLQQRMAEVYASAVNAEIMAELTEQEEDVLIDLLKHFDPPLSASTCVNAAKSRNTSYPEAYS